MSAAYRAFPILQTSGVDAKTHLAEVVGDVLPRVEAVLRLRHGGAAGTTGRSSPPLRETTAVPLTLAVGDTIEVPLSCLGRVAGGALRDDTAELVLHSPGLPGAFLVPFTALSACRGQWRLGREMSSSSGDGQSYAEQLGALCCLEAVQAGWEKETVLNTLYTIARRRHFSVTGTQRLLEKGVQIAPEALKLDFPYHCGGAQATRRYFDTSADVCHFFEPHGGHGTRCLSRYGTAVSVGVAVDEAADSAVPPQLYWHPTGAVAACLAPALSGCALLPVGQVKLPYNGPLRDSELVQVEDPRRYMRLTSDDSPLDTTTWLCEGLFGVRPGTTWRGLPQLGQGHEPLSVVGVGFDARRQEMELFLRNEKTGDIRVADDV